MPRNWREQSLIPVPACLVRYLQPTPLCYFFTLSMLCCTTQMMLPPPLIKISIQCFISFQASPCIRILARSGHSTPKLSENPSRSGHIWAWNHQLIRPSINKGAPARRRNIRFIASSARAGEHLMCSPCEQDCPSRQPYASRTVPDQAAATTAQYRRASPNARQSQCHRS